jgi:hypothetical protein
MQIVRDARVINAILRKMAKENNFEFENVYVNQYHKYIQTIDHDKKDADFCLTNYKGKNYKVQYFSGCFNPYLVELN